MDDMLRVAEEREHLINDDLHAFNSDNAADGGEAACGDGADDSVVRLEGFGDIREDVDNLFARDKLQVVKSKNWK